MLSRFAGIAVLWLVGSIGCLAASAALPVARNHRAPHLEIGPDLVEIGNLAQAVRFARGSDGRFRLSTGIAGKHGPLPLFDAELPLVQGSHFDLQPSSFRVLEDSSRRVAVEVSGTHGTPRYDWRILIESRAETPFLRFQVTCDLKEQLILAGLEPQFAFWMKQPAVTVSIDQGPGNIYRGADDVEWGNSFPAAYLWDAGREAALFIDATPMTWMSARNLFRFRDCRVQSWPEGGRTGFGLRVVKRNFHEVPPGELTFDAYLYSGLRPQKPSRLDALDRLTRLVAPFHPRTASLPVNRKPPHTTSWSVFANGVAKNLMLKDIVWDEVRLPKDKPWRDEPAFPEDTVDAVPVSLDYAVDSACEPRFNRTSVLQGWDFSTCNNYLSGWIAYERLKPDPAQRAHLARKEKALPLFYDPQSRLIRHGTRYPEHVGDKEMSWQNLMFALEMAKVHRLTPVERFNPAVGGKLLQSMEGLIDLARQNDYLLPQWFDPITKKALIQNDEPDLGMIFEPWQIGTWAYLMSEAYELTGDRRYLKEATTGLDRFFSGMTYKVENARYKRTYSDPTEFPITEIFGNAWGAAAAARLAESTKEPKFRRYSGHFLNSLLRMTYWYESNLREDLKDRALGLAGLFRNQGGACTGSPWENGEAYLALTQLLRHSSEVRAPLARMFNTYRRNSFYFFPPVFPDAAVPCAKLFNHPADYLPIEDAYTHEHGGANGGMGRSAYMSGIAFWNYVMFDAFADVDDPEVMVLSLDTLDTFDQAVKSLERRFLVYNGTEKAKSARLRLRDLRDGRYQITERRGSRRSKQTFSAESLRQGYPLTLPPDETVKVDVTRLQSPDEHRSAHDERIARYRLTAAYQRLQLAAVENRPGFAALKQNYQTALACLRRGEFKRADKMAKSDLSRPSANAAESSRRIGSLE